MSLAETPLEKARRHVREGEQLVSQQAIRVERLRRNGHDICLAEELLVAFEQTLTIMREHLAEEERMHGGKG